MNTVDLIQKFLELGFKQSALEKYCSLPKGKITDILKGRDRLKQQTRDTIVEGLTKLKEEISNIDTNTTEEGEVGNYSVYVHIFPNEKDIMVLAVHQKTGGDLKEIIIKIKLLCGTPFKNMDGIILNMK